jgi:hypothetical protein
VEDREERDHGHREGQGQSHPPEHQGTEHHGRQGNADLYARQRSADQPKHAAGGHQHREGHRQDPQRRHAELGAPETDRDHRDDMVEPGNRVRQAAQETAGLCGFDVGPGGQGPRQDHHNEGRGHDRGPLMDMQLRHYALSPLQNS